MALVDRRGLTRQSLPAVAAGRAAAKKQRRHRVVIETVAQEQKKLKTTITFQARPPNGYTFIPAGNPDLTNALKEASRHASQQIYAVSTSTHAKVHDLSKEVHRVGFHFPSAIVAQVCAQYGITLTSKGVVADENAATFRQMRQRGQWEDDNDALKDQITINTEARGAIKDLFPKIPENDLYTIIKGAFQKGQRKVGTANELPLVRRAQLSVVAHVRHIYTRYDKLLRTVGYREARSQVEGPTLKKLVEWRGDDDNTNNGKQVLEDVFREVIVLSDDEDSDDDVDDTVEIMPARASAWPLPSHHSTANIQPLSPRQYGYQSAEDDIPGYRVVTQAPRRRLVDLASQTGTASNQYRQSRYAAWDRAREEYRANPSAVPAALVPLSQHDPKFYYQEPKFNFNDPPTRSRQGPTDTQRPREPVNYASRPVVHDHHRIMQPELVRGADGHLYERIYTQSLPGPVPQRRNEGPQTYVSSRPPSPRHAPLFEEQDLRVQPISPNIIPSIEDNQLRQEAGRSRAPRMDSHQDHPLARHEIHPESVLRSRNVEVIDLTDVADAQSAKRFQVDEPFNAWRMVSDVQTRPREGPIRQVYEPQHHRREIIDLSSPEYVRDPVLASPRMAQQRKRDDRVLVVDGQASRPDTHTVRSMARGPLNAPRNRYAYAAEGYQTQEPRFASPPRFIREGRMSYGTQAQASLSPNAEYRPEDPAIRSEDFLGRRAANHRDVPISSVRVPAQDGDHAFYSREYTTVTRNEIAMTDAPIHRISQRQQSLYVDPPQPGRYDSSRNRYEASDAGRPLPFLSSPLT